MTDPAPQEDLSRSGLPSLEEYQFESRDGNGRRYLLAFFLASVLLLSSTLAMNVVVDPRSEFGSRHYEPLIPDRPMQKLDLFNALDETPKTVILGTSRTAALRPSDLDADGLGPAFNYALAGSSFRDAVIVYDHLVRTGRAPEVVIHGLEASLFNPDARLQIDRSPAREEYTGEPRELTELVALGIGSLSRNYLLDTLRSLYMAHWAGYPENMLQLEADGHTVPPEGFGRGNETKRNSTIYRQVNRELLPFAAQYPGIDPTTAAVFHSYVDRMVEHGTTPYLFLPPIHPLATGLLDEKLPRWREVNGALREQMLRHCDDGAHVFDLTDPLSFGGDPDEFQDAIHFGYDTGAALLHAIATLDGDLCAEVP